MGSSQLGGGEWWGCCVEWASASASGAGYHRTMRQRWLIVGRLPLKWMEREYLD